MILTKDWRKDLYQLADELGKRDGLSVSTVGHRVGVAGNWFKGLMDGADCTVDKLLHVHSEIKSQLSEGGNG